MHKILFRVLNWYPCAYNSKALSVAQGQNGCLARTRPCTGSRPRTENETEHNKSPLPQCLISYDALPQTCPPYKQPLWPLDF